MSLEHGGGQGPEVQFKNNEITSLKCAKEAAGRIKEESFDNLLIGVLEYEFGAVRDSESLEAAKQTVRLNGPIQVEKLNAQSGEWEPVLSDGDLIKHLEGNLGLVGNTNPDKNKNHLTEFVTKVACGVEEIKRKYVDHQLTLIGHSSEHSREVLDKHTAVDLEGRIKFKKINSKGKVFNYSVRSGKSFRVDASTVLETRNRVSVSEKDLEKGVNSDVAAFLTGASVVLLNEFVVHGDHKTLQALAIAGTAIGYISKMAADRAEKAFVGTRIETFARKIKKVATGVFYGSMGIAGAEIVTNLAHGIIYQSERHESIGTEAHMNNETNGEIHHIDHVPSYNHPEQQAYGAEVPDTQHQKPTLENLSQTDPRHTTESQLHTQVNNIIGDTDWVNPENGVTKADVITQWVQRLWVHNKGGPLTKAEVEAMKMVNESKSFLDFMRIRPFINKFIASNVN